MSQQAFRRRWRGWIHRVTKGGQRVPKDAFPMPLAKLPPLTRYWLTVCRRGRRQGGSGKHSGVIFAPGPNARRVRLRLKMVAEYHCGGW